MKLKKSFQIQFHLWKQLFNLAYQQHLKYFLIPFTLIIFQLTKELCFNGIILGWKFYTYIKNNKINKYLFIYLNYDKNQNNLLCLNSYRTLKIHNIITRKHLLNNKESLPCCLFFNGKSFNTQTTLIQQNKKGILIFIFI